MGQKRSEPRMAFPEAGPKGLKELTFCIRTLKMVIW
jgi:hypothetical protein